MKKEELLNIFVEFAKSPSAMFHFTNENKCMLMIADSL